MIETFKFGRLDVKTTAKSFKYDVQYGNDAKWTNRDLEMVELGSHISVTIKNYMREDLLLVDNVRSEPKRHVSIYQNDRFLLEDTTNFVIIEIRTREVERGKDNENKIRKQSRTEIRCPGHLLQTHSLYIEELGSYITIQPRLQATRELIANDSRFPDSKEISVPESMVKPDPVSTMRKFEPLVKNCLERADKIRVKVGVRVDKDPSRVPDYVKNLRISVMDRDFSPYHNNRMVYDPELLPEEFVVENLHLVTSEPLISTFDRLHKNEDRAFFIDTQEHRTLGGNLVGLAIFADPEALHTYLFTHKSHELYDELMEGFADKTGNPVLRKRIETLEESVVDKDTRIVDLEENIKFEQGQVKTLKRQVSAHEDTIKKIRDNHDTNMSYESFQNQIENEKKRFDLERERLMFERDELLAKLKISQQTQKTAFLKSIADGAKSVWGILVIVSAAAVAGFKWWNKLKSS
jgi:hypothetical protein